MYKIVFLGTPHFVVPILESLHQHHQVIAVITQPDQPVGRKNILTPPPIKTKAKELGLKVFQPQKIKEIKTDLEAFNADFFITYAYGQLIPQSILDLPKKDNLNIHPSLLPLYRGATPPQSALLNGDTKTGVTIIRMIKEMDAGPIFAQQEYGIDPDMRFPELVKELTEIAVDQLQTVLKNYENITPIEQEIPESEDHNPHLTCTKITKHDGKINFANETAQQIYNKLRAYTPWPGIYTFWNNQKLSFTDITISNEQATGVSVGAIFEEGGNIYIKTKENSDQEGTERYVGFGIKINRLQLAGKNETDIKSFINGYPDFINSQLT